MHTYTHAILRTYLKKNGRKIWCAQNINERRNEKGKPDDPRKPIWGDNFHYIELKDAMGSVDVCNLNLESHNIGWCRSLCQKHREHC